MIASPPRTPRGESLAGRVVTPHSAPRFTSHSTTKNVVLAKRGGSGSENISGGSGYDWLPDLHHIQFEQRTDRPGVAAWHAPKGAKAPRNTKTYLGYLGKRLLAEWLALPPRERLEVVSAWVAERRKEKGVEI